MNTIFFGSSRYILPVIEKLHAEFNLRLVVTTEQKETDAVPAYCIVKNIPYVSVTTVTNKAFIQELKNLGCPVAVLADFRLIVPKELMDIFPKGIINIHPSLLPAFRGPTPGVAAILSGAKETGVSIMLLDEELDHGPILAQENTSIELNDTADTLYPRLFTIGSDLLGKTLHRYVEGTLSPTPQDHTKATYTSLLTKQTGFIDLANPPAPEKLHNMIRAYSPWPGVWTRMTLYGKERIVKLLPNAMFQVEGKKPMIAKDFLNGYPEAREILQKLSLI